MLRKIIERTTGTLTDAEFAEVLDLTTVDIKVNRIGFSQRTSLAVVVEIAGMCLRMLRRCRVA